MGRPEFFWISGSPPCWSTMLALEIKGLDYTSKRLESSRREQKSEAFLKINPRGHVPVLKDGDTVVRESPAILAYLEAAHPAPPLLGTTPVETAKIWQMACEADAHLRTPIGDLARPIFRGRASECAEDIRTGAKRIRSELDDINDQLSAQRYLTGESITAADVVVFPAIMQLARAASRDDAGPLELELYPFAEFFPNIAEWIARVESLPGYERTYPPHWR